MNILVIGGAGYIGSNFVEMVFNTTKNEIVILDDLSTGFKELIHPRAKFYLGNQNDPKILNKIMAEQKIDVVAHFAAKTIVPESVAQPAKYYLNSVGALSRIIQAMVDNGVKNLIFSSTAAVYGFPKTIPVTETDDKNPCNPYGASKLASEWLIKSAIEAYGINAIILRYFNVAGASDSGLYGSREMKPTLLIPVINKSLIEKFQMKVFGTDYEKTRDGSCLRDFIHVADLVKAHILAINWMVKNNASNDFNLGTSSGYTVLEVLKEVNKTLDKKVDFIVAPRRIGDPDRLITKNDKANDILHWKPTHSLQDMIKSDYNFRIKLYK